MFTIDNGKKKVVKTEIFSRISGYYRPVQNWNKAKRQEFSERQYLDIEEFKK